MANTYWLRFGFGDPRTLTGLSPTFLIFKDNTGTNATAPSIAEVGAGTGLYAFSYGPTLPMGFLIDAATTSPGSAGRYVAGSIDPADAAGATIAGIGSTASSFGDSTTDPVDLFGYLKRLLENLEGNQSYIKPTGALTISSRGSSVTLRTKTITNSVTTTIKT